MVSKADKKQRKEAKQRAAKRREVLFRRASWAFGIIVVVLGLYVFGRGLFGGPPSMPPDRVGEHDQVRGSADAPLTVTVYADFECPSCAREMQAVSRAWDDVEDDVRLVYRHFPLDTHEHAFLAARYAEAAGRQGQFWEMHDLLFSRQQAWAGSDNARERFDALAEELGLDMEQLHADVNSSAVRDKIIADRRGGARAGVRGTPTMFINGDEVNSVYSPGGFVDLVEEHLAER